MIKEEPGVKEVISVAGFNLLKGAQSSNAGLGFVILENWDQRQDPNFIRWPLCSASK